MLTYRKDCQETGSPFGPSEKVLENPDSPLTVDPDAEGILPVSIGEQRPLNERLLPTRLPAPGREQISYVVDVRHKSTVRHPTAP